MTKVSLSVLHGVLPLDVETPSTVGQQQDVSSTRSFLKQIFGTDFNIVDGDTGEPLHVVPGQPAYDWDRQGEVCREVARRGRPEFLEGADPFFILAIPIPQSGGGILVGVGLFVSRAVALDEDVSSSARFISIDPMEAAVWATRQTPWSSHSLERLAELTVIQAATQRQTNELQKESDNLSIQLASTYEEISLLYRLTQNLRLSKSNVELGQVALEWLEDVLPAKGMIIELIQSLDTNDTSATPESQAKSQLLTHGECPIDKRQFSQLVEHLNLEKGNRPVVVNRLVTQDDTWPCPQVRQVIAIPLAEGDNIFGWLAAVNHVDDSEFGTVEANLLSSVGAILGIHSGNIELYRQQSELLAGIVRALTSAIDAKDPYTCGHSERVARVSVRLAAELGCDSQILETIYLSGLLHDIGKIGIDDQVLRKPDSLTDLEYEHIKSHVDIGHKILWDLKKLDEVLPVVLHHHESWDGSGYPHNLPAEEIPFSARIVAVADAFDAMGSDRPYRKGMVDAKIDEIFHAGSGKQWDPDIVDAFFQARDDIREISQNERQGLDLKMTNWG